MTHRRQRRILNPLFSTQNLRNISPVFASVAARSCNFVSGLLSSGNKQIDMYDVFLRTVLDAVGESTLGHSFGALEDSSKPLSNAFGRLL